MHGHRETLHWYGTGYYGLLSTENGYGGFDYNSDCLYMNQSIWTAPGGRGYEFHWCDTGYQNVLAMGGGACCGWIYEDGLMASASKHSFTLDSVIAASAWNTDAVWDVESYTRQGHRLVLKASDKLTISQTAERIDFAKFGHKGDFTNIDAVGFKLIHTGQYGNSCTYHGGRTGFVLCLDAMKVTFSGKGGHAAGETGLRFSGSSPLHPHVAALAAFHVSHATVGGEGHYSLAQTVQTEGGYQTQLASFGQDQNLTDQFALPGPEHLGF